MYYYIFDIKKCKKKTQVEDIKNHLLSLGISGEFSYPSSGQSVEDLVDIGLEKQYNTIVGIGGDEIAAKIANKLCGKTEAMGLIPLEASPDLETLIGAKSWREGCENLRYRRIKEIKIGKTGNNTAFLTNTYLAINSPIEVTIEFKDYLVQANVTKLVISNYSAGIQKLSEDFLDISMTSVSSNSNSILKSLSSLLGMKKGQNSGESIFRARSLRVFTKYQIPFSTHETTIAKTPQFFEISDDTLRIITAKKGQQFWG